MRGLKKCLLFVVISTLIIFICLLFFQTKPATSIDDQKIIRHLLSTYNIPKNKEESFAAQIKQIMLVQKAVIDISGESYTTRNNHRAKGAAELYKTKNGICYDNSYVMEQIFKELGYEYRHVFWLFIPADQPYLMSFFSNTVRSHASVEVKTKKGWMHVESLSRYIGLDQENNVFSASALNMPYWNASVTFPSVITPSYLDKRACIFYGLYSRNGKLFPPDIPVPDYNCRQLLYNFTAE